MPKIVTLTMNPTIDKSTSVEHVVPDDKLRCGPLTNEPGGGGINVSRAIQKLGGESLALYTAGGLSGSLLQKLLNEEELNNQAIQITQPIRENVIVLETATERQYRFTMPGPELRQEEWQRCLDIVDKLDSPPKYLVASGSLPPGTPKDFFARLARRLKAQDTRFVLDTSAYEALRQAAEEGLYLLKPNMREFRELTGRPLEDEAAQEEAAMELIDSGQCQVVVLSLGAAGVMLVTEEGCSRLRAPTVPIKSKVGAGDSTVGGIMLKLAEGASIKEAVQYGVAAGAAAVMTPGTELCRKDDTEQLFQRIKG